ncbi:MAG: azurin [Cellvibrionaceae bacterium]
MRMQRLFVLTAALSLTAFAGSVLGQECSVTVDSNDVLQYDTDAITVNSDCQEFTVNLTHSGKLAKNVMGHNWVLSQAEDVQGIASDGITAGLDNNYLMPDDERVIAATAIIGGGEMTSVTFPVGVLEAGTNYTFFCSFPGHSAVMQGTLLLE